MSTIKYAAAVNLGNYESLRVEVEGEGADTAKMALDQALASVQGDAGNPAVVDAIARYRKGVLGRSGLLSEERAPPRDSLPRKSEAEQGKAWVGKAGPTAVARLEEPAPVTPDQISPLPERIPAPTPAPAAGDGVCERCGAGVSKSQAKLSQLFMSKTLCKACMEAP